MKTRGTSVATHQEGTILVVATGLSALILLLSLMVNRSLIVYQKTAVLEYHRQQARLLALSAAILTSTEPNLPTVSYHADTIYEQISQMKPLPYPVSGRLYGFATGNGDVGGMAIMENGARAVRLLPTEK